MVVYEFDCFKAQRDLRIQPRPLILSKDLFQEVHLAGAND
ncbi:hypothetical protein ES332_D13G080800v1 [Gossypium tomentosum]|uniref:Uncharacterized protein n=1 Tax=Gossypium tomentosum TaxID=34277 RepID=A0A5D2HU69_GOSTO|nr:hypothetical protein ES332_D13G080800v1 [Gossypium tomentosum]